MQYKLMNEWSNSLNRLILVSIFDQVTVQHLSRINIKANAQNFITFQDKSPRLYCSSG